MSKENRKKKNQKEEDESFAHGTHAGSAAPGLHAARSWAVLADTAQTPLVWRPVQSVY